MGSAGKKLRTRVDIGKDIQSCLDDLNNMTHAKLAELLNLSEKTVDRMVAGKGPITKYASDLAKITGKPESWFKENITWEECEKERLRLFILRLKMCQTKKMKLWEDYWHI